MACLKFAISFYNNSLNLSHSLQFFTIAMKHFIYLVFLTINLIVKVRKVALKFFKIKKIYNLELSNTS